MFVIHPLPMLPMIVNLGRNALGYQVDGVCSNQREESWRSVSLLDGMQIIFILRFLENYQGHRVPRPIVGRLRNGGWVDDS